MLIYSKVLLSCEDRMIITEDEVKSTFQCSTARKAMGPDLIRPFVVKTFAKELAPVWQPILERIADNPHITLQV